MFGIFIAVIVLLVYGSLYPWQFVPRHLTAGPLYILLHAWHVWPGRRFVFDVIVNVAIYVPLGMSGHLALRRYRPRKVRLAVPVLIGILLSASVEMIQLFTPSRDCSAIDLTTNICGTIIGVAAGAAFAGVVKLPGLDGRRYRVRDAAALSLLICWACALLFPLFPVMSLAMWEFKARGFFHRAPFFVPFVVSAASWFAVSRLISAMGSRSPLRWTALLFVLIPLQFAVVTRQPMPADLAGALTGFVLGWLLGVSPRPYAAAAFALLGAIVLRGLWPFRFAQAWQEFSWIPFAGLLNTEWQTAVQVLLRKLFEYGAAIWLLHRAGARLTRATLGTAGILAGVEFAQIFTTGHVAEITDPLLALMLGPALRAASLFRGTILRIT